MFLIRGGWSCWGEIMTRGEMDWRRRELDCEKSEGRGERRRKGGGGGGRGGKTGTKRAVWWGEKGGREDAQPKLADTTDHSGDQEISTNVEIIHHTSLW